jgi:hypothetical protein
LELLAIITIVFILIFLMSGVLSKLPGAADRVQCTQNLKTIHVGLSGYLEEKGRWPKEPPLTYQQRKERENFWIDALKPYGVPEASWECPGITRLGKLKADGYVSRMHYQVTAFDEKAGTPRKWPIMPWVVEIGNAHGHGPLLILMDGSVHDWDPYIEKFAK